MEGASSRSSDTFLKYENEEEHSVMIAEKGPWNSGEMRLEG